MSSDNCEGKVGVVQHLALVLVVDGENAGQWIPTLVPVDKNGLPVQRFAEPDIRYPQGLKSYGFLGLYYDHKKLLENGDEEIHTYALYKQRYTMKDTARIEGMYDCDASERLGRRIKC